jgi:hypothetical protein
MTQLRGSRAGYTVQCVLCGRAAGEVLGGVFRRDQRVQPPRMDHGAARCGECGGNLYLEPGLAAHAGYAPAPRSATKTGLPAHVGGHVPAGPPGGR